MSNTSQVVELIFRFPNWSSNGKTKPEEPSVNDWTQNGAVQETVAVRGGRRCRRLFRSSTSSFFLFLIYGNRKLKGLNCAQQFARDPGSPMKVTPSVVPFMAVA